eukprot:CAMPEP_0194037118 /NCGR_PEP_ID=MMETSP0009_2-20130614/9462_1 /TAXON_ID=210454 /ORGANISM="Grammatophora oceanica, Strain CCMP 410" /LENGTH=186 /DNA_ID=CAMNT_0038679145 /DNA_START=64 /DNA_END=624 /DNA_ORIENTATION=-
MPPNLHEQKTSMAISSISTYCGSFRGDEVKSNDLLRIDNHQGKDPSQTACKPNPDGDTGFLEQQCLDKTNDYRSAIDEFIEALFESTYTNEELTLVKTVYELMVDGIPHSDPLWFHHLAFVVSEDTEQDVKQDAEEHMSAHQQDRGSFHELLEGRNGLDVDMDHDELEVLLKTPLSIHRSADQSGP